MKALFTRVLRAIRSAASKVKRAAVKALGGPGPWTPGK